MPELKWEHDEGFYELAKKFELNISELEKAKHPENPPEKKFKGKICQDLTHLKDLVEYGTVLEPFDYTVDGILTQIREKKWLTVVLQVSMWGGMVNEDIDHVFSKIYHKPKVEIRQERKSAIITAVKEAYDGLLAEKPLETVFNYFEPLKWSNTMTSKVLHFLSIQALDKVSDVPVPIDDAMVQKKLWKAYCEVLERNGSLKLGDKNITKGLKTSEFDYEKYNMFLSSMKGWADKADCSIKYLEESLFAYHKSPIGANTSKNKTNGKEEFVKLFPN